MYRQFKLPRFFALFTSIVLQWGLASEAFTAEYLDTERVAPTSALEDATAMATEFEEVQDRRVTLLDKILDRNAITGSFWRDSALSFNARIYKFDRQTLSDKRADVVAGGGTLDLHSGRWKDRVSLGLTYAYSTDLDISNDEVPVGLLSEDGSSLSVISEAFVRLDARDSELSSVLYRQSFNLPYLNRQDSRMVPNTFEAYRVDYSTKKMDMLVTYVDSMKKQNSNKFVSMSKVAGSSHSDGVFAAGFRLNLKPFHFGAINYYNKDTMNIFYLDTNLVGSYKNGIDYQIRTQLASQRSTGKENIGDFKTWHWGISAVSSWQDIVLNLKYTITGDDAAIKSPWGGRPHYNSLMVLDFDRAGEQSTGARISYSLGRWKLPEFSMSMNYAEGRKAHDENGMALEDEDEFDITLDYKPVSSRFKGLWIRLRYAEVDRGDEDGRDFRAIFNYKLNDH